jgi:hypothetical protein
MRSQPPADARVCRRYAGPMPTTPPPPAARRSPLAILDIVVGVLLVIVTAMIGAIMLAYVTQLSSLSSECEGIAPDGARCDPGFLAAMGIVGTGIVVFAWFLSAGFVIVRAIQRKIVFFIPLIGFAVMIAGYYVVLALVGSSYLPSSST